MDGLLKALLFILLSIVVPLSFYIKQIEIIYLIGFALLCVIFIIKHNHKLYILTKTPLRFYLVFLYISFISETILLITNMAIFKLTFSSYVRIWIYFLLMMFVLSVSFKKSMVMDVVNSIIISSFIPNIIAVIQFKYNIFTIINSLEGQRRLGSTFSHPNFYAYYIVIVIICLLYKKNSMTKKIYKTYLYIYIALNALLLIVTYARTPMIVLIVIILSSVINYSFSKHNYLTVVTISFSMVIFSVIIYLILNSNVFLTSRFNISENGSSFTWRLGMWSSAMSYWSKSIIYIIFGCGWVTSKEFVKGAAYQGLNMHNEFLRLIFDTGVFGFIYYFTFFIELIVKIKKSNISKIKKVLLRNLTILLVIACADDNILIAPENCIYLIVLFAAVYAESYWRKDEEFV
ncbi:MAG: O-antigen polymerase [Clostridiaceae bacterium]|jgi:O-antigen ligase|nr:O-antigen polymerase [Clostridiaceae bacterium]